ncbi:glutathione S-transferase family protein [Ensifer sp.]|uniref:glutathione S-transferase family protein n=1 Tax=Ensifer sp. TaxID=1872086 RepID=UPI002E135BFB|nr:glutathione S-transferase family protein [Ensifer sp.]
MSLTLYQHPLASFCHKVLIALYENDTPFKSSLVDLLDPAEAARFAALWPAGKMPVLTDSARDVVMPETSVIIEYLDRHYPGKVKLIPDDVDRALKVRLWDRFFDLYVHVPMQKIVTDTLRSSGENDRRGVEDARATLNLAYGMADKHLAENTFAAGDSVSLADCAASPALFYGGIVEPFDEKHPHLAAYFERLLERASVRRVLAEARPYFHMFPYRNLMPERFFEM